MLPLLDQYEMASVLAQSTSQDYLNVVWKSSVTMLLLSKQQLALKLVVISGIVV